MTMQLYVIVITINPKWPPQQNGGVHIYEQITQYVDINDTYH